jgi:hypothetical protein
MIIKKQTKQRKKKQRDVKILLNGEISKAMSPSEKSKKCYYENIEYRELKKQRMREYYRNKIVNSDFLELCKICYAFILPNSDDGL